MRWRLTRYILSAFVLLAAFRTLLHSVAVLDSPLVYRKDFLQDFLMARALMEGLDPYLGISQLGTLLMPDLPATIFPHPSPHPPVTLFLSLPLASLAYPQAAFVWLLVEMALLCVISWQALRILSIEGPRIKTFATILVLLLATQAVYTDLLQGQLSLLLLALFIFAMLAIRDRKDVLAGLWLGIAFSVKFLGLPVFLYLVLRRRWTPCLIAGLTFLFLNLMAALAFGPQVVGSYYGEVAPVITPLYRGDAYNQSLFTLGERLWIGLVPQVQEAVRAPGLFHAPVLARVTDLAVAGILVLVVIGLARRASEMSALALAVALSALASPVAWVHGLVLCFPAVLLGYGLLETRGWPTGESLAGGAICLGLAMGDLFGRGMARGGAEVSFLQSLVTWIPLVMASSLVFLVFRMEVTRRKTDGRGSRNLGPVHPC
jgi:hypothetical protein